ncbi:MAG TPA: U32 family peptidase [Jiangellaceae bacterium]
MEATRSFLASLGLPRGDDARLATSPLRFDDGAQYRVEIPSVEGPQAFEAVLETAADYGVRVHRISQGSGIMLQTDTEIERMVALGKDHDVEVSLFTGPRAAWDVGVQVTSSTGRVLGASLRGADQLVYGIEDVRRGCELGLRSVLIADLGQLWVLAEMKAGGELPADLILKVSVSLPVANPATARVLQDLGASTLNLPVDLQLGHIAAIRQAVAVPLDVYVEGADDFGAPVRHYELPEMVRVAAPVYLKFTVRNAPNLYPSGRHLERLAIDTARERVRRAAIGLSMLKRYYPEAETGRLSPSD